MLLQPSVSVGLDASGEDLLLKKHCGAALLWKLKDLVHHAEHRASRSGVFTDLSENCRVFQSGLNAGGGISPLVLPEGHFSIFLQPGALQTQLACW